MTAAATSEEGSPQRRDSGQLLRLCPSAARCGSVPAVTNVLRKREECWANLHNSVTP